MWGIAAYGRRIGGLGLGGPLIHRWSGGRYSAVLAALLEKRSNGRLRGRGRRAPPLRAAPLPPKSHRPWLSPMGRPLHHTNQRDLSTSPRCSLGLQTGMRRFYASEATNFGVRSTAMLSATDRSPPDWWCMHELFLNGSAVQTFQTPFPRRGSVSITLQMVLDARWWRRLKALAGHSVRNSLSRSVGCSQSDVGGSVNQISPVDLSLETPSTAKTNDSSTSVRLPSTTQRRVLTDWDGAVSTFPPVTSHHAYVDLGGERGRSPQF